MSFLSRLAERIDHQTAITDARQQKLTRLIMERAPHGQIHAARVEHHEALMFLEELHASYRTLVQTA